MINFDDLNKAEENIEKLFELRDELINSSSLLNDMKSKIQWYKKAITDLPEEADNFYTMIEHPIESVLSITPTNLDYSSVTGATGSFYSVSGDARHTITSYKKTHYQLLEEYEELNHTETLIDQILVFVDDMRQELKEYDPTRLLEESKKAYAKWIAGAIDNSELAASIRAFQDVFKGCLRDSWVKASKLNKPKFSWDKMAEAIGKKGGGKKSLLHAKGAEDEFHDAFTRILKKTKVVSKDEMEIIFKGYIEHLYGIINLVDQGIMT